MAQAFEISTSRNKKHVKFEGDKTKYEIDPLDKTLEELEGYEVEFVDYPSSDRPSSSSWFERFKNYLLHGGGTPKPKPKPVVTTKITANTVKALIGSTARNWLFADSDYFVTDMKTALDQIKYYKVANFTYELPYYDCDDFSFAAMGAIHLSKETAKMAFFIIWVSYKRNGKSYGHALNGACTADKFYVIEPQNYKVYDFPPDWTLQVLIG